MNTMTGYHFLARPDQLRDGTPTPAVGVKLRLAGPPVLCAHGFHASRRPIDALQYAPGAWLCKVRLSGQIVADTDKFVATERTILAGPVDVTRELRLFACDCAADVLPIFEKQYPRDARPREAIAAARRYAEGKATPEELVAARAAAGDAAWAAAWVAARAAAGDAAWAAARAAARAAAGDAAWAAARAAAGDAAWDAAWEAAWSAARAAARDAAGDAAGDAQNRRLARVFKAALL